MFKFIQRLREAGVIGINARNRDYVMPANPRALYSLVDDKVRSKLLAERDKIAVPKLYGVVNSPHDARNVENIISGLAGFVIKPAHGSGGKGILVIDGQRGAKFFKSDGTPLTSRDLSHHIQNILGGVYSLGGQPDVALIEYRVTAAKVFDTISYRGVPDVRVLVYRGVPALAMLRLPTKSSGGRANLHQGAVGVGIDMLSGICTTAVCENRKVHEHPDYGCQLAGFAIPHWHEILALSARCQQLAPLGYLGVDLVIDEELGPMMLELNARPGLAIQIANGRGLKPLLDTIDNGVNAAPSVEEKLALAYRLARQDGQPRGASQPDPVRFGYATAWRSDTPLSDNAPPPRRAPNLRA